MSFWDYLGHIEAVINILLAIVSLPAGVGASWALLSKSGKLVHIRKFIGWVLVAVAVVAYSTDLADRFGFLWTLGEKEGPSCIKVSMLDSASKQRVDVFSKEAHRQLDFLGKPIGCLNIISDSSRGDFDKATEIWTSNPPEMKFLFRNPANWDSFPEPGPCADQWCQHGNVAQNREYFEKLLNKNNNPIPSDRFPPFGGTALFLNGFPEFFEKLGWQIWQCEQAAPTFFQVFEKGTLYGPYQSQLHDQRAEIFALFNDKTWKAFRADDKLALCGPGSF